MNFEYVTSDTPIVEICDRILASEVIGLDIETIGLDPILGQIRLVQLKLGERIYVVDFFKVSEESQLKIAKALEESKGIKIGHNLKFEQKWFLYHFGIELWPIFDTYRASNLIYNGTIGKKHDLWSVFESELGLSHTSGDFQTSNWRELELSQGQLEYAAEDVHHLYDLRDVLRKKIIENRLVTVAKIEFEVVLPESAVELNGFMLDKPRWSQILEENLKQRKHLEKELLQDLPHPFGQLFLFDNERFWNLDSSKQMLNSLHRIKGGEELEDTNNISLVMVADNVPLIKKVIEYREVSKKCTSYSETYLNACHSLTNRIHCNFSPFLLSGRYGIRSPNLGQIPRDEVYRACFIAQEDSKLIIGDWKNIEMCIIAELSRDRELLRIFNEGGDAHLETAAALNTKPKSEVSKKERQQAKPLNFGFGYGMGAPKLVLYAKSGYGVDLSIGDAFKFRRKWFKKYKGVGTWHEGVLAEGKRTKISRTLSGRRRFMHEEAHGEYLNNPVQGTGADMLKTALRYVYDGLKAKTGFAPVRSKGFEPPVMMVNHVHDEVVLEAKEGFEFIGKAVLQEGMKRAGEVFLHSVPVVVEGGMGPTWASK